MYNQKAYALGSVRSYIREVFEYGRQQAKLVGEENVYDYSLGNPSIPAPEQVNESLHRILNTVSSIKVHGYTSGPGDDGIREAGRGQPHGALRQGDKAREPLLHLRRGPGAHERAHGPRLPRERGHSHRALLPRV